MDKKSHRKCKTATQKRMVKKEDDGERKEEQRNDTRMEVHLQQGGA